MVKLSRRHLLAGTVAGLAMTPVARALPAGDGLPMALRRRALAALERHAASLVHRDRIGIADYAASSSEPRFYLLDLASGRSERLLVAHGRGSDPAHSGWLQHFSNEPGSAASSAGAYVTGEIYVGKHGASRRLHGLEAQNSNAEARAIVIHGAWYANPDMIGQHGKLGRSEGCFAFPEADIGHVLDRLGTGRLLYSDKL